MRRHYAEMERIEVAVLRMMSVGLGREPGTFGRMLGEHKALLQCTFYPGAEEVQQRGAALTKGVEHADYLSFIGLGWPHETGLELLNESVWERVPVLPGHFEVIIGDLAQRLSNGRYRAS